MIETKNQIYNLAISSILVVDDELDNLLLITSYLKKNRLEIITAQTGMLALEKAKERKFDVVLMDINMPGLNGMETAEMIKADSENKETKILALTAFTESEIDLPSFFDGIIKKPISKEALFKNLSLSLTS